MKLYKSRSGATPYHVWSPEKSRRAHAAKERRRLEAKPPRLGPPYRVPKPRTKAKFIVTVRDQEHGDRVQFKVYDGPWGRICTNGKTITDNCNGLRLMLANAA